MRVEVGVKESSKNKLVKSTWAGHVEKWEIKTGKESRCPESGGNGSETNIAMGVAFK